MMSLLKGDSYMKKFGKVITVLTITCALCFCACGSNEKVEPVEVKEEISNNAETVEAEKVSTDDISEYVECSSSKAILDYVSDDKQTVGMYMTFHVNNKRESDVVSDLLGTISLYTEFSELISSESVSIGTLAPKETGIVSAYFEISREDLESNPRAVLDIQSLSSYDVSALNGFKQSNLAYDNFKTISDGVMNTEVLLDVINNSKYDVKQPNVIVICKKDGKYAGVADSNMVGNIKPGKNTIHIDASHIIPSDCDEYEVFIDYMDWNK